MAVLHDYQCSEHGVFEAKGHFCPECGKPSKLIYIKPPSTPSARTQMRDKMVDTLMNEFHLTDTPKQRDFRETNPDAVRVHSNANSPVTSPQQFNLPPASSLEAGSQPANEVFNAMKSRGHRRVPISLAISDKG